MPLSSVQQQFEEELDIFRTETQAAVQFFYAYLAVYAVAADHERVHQLLDSAPLFWNTNLAALQTATFIAIGRVFDQNSRHNVDRLLRIAQDGRLVFSKNALAARKQGNSSVAPKWLPEYLRGAYVPEVDDFRRLRAHVRKHRKVYESKYRDLRHKVFAHRGYSAHAEAEALYARTNIRELQRMLVFLSSLYEALWQLYVNGRKPTLRPQRYSVRSMRHSPMPEWRSGTVQERMTSEVERFLREAARVDATGGGGN